MSVLRGAALSAGLALGLIALAPSAYAQNYGQPYWNGAPNAAGPNQPGGPAYGPPPGGWGPNYGGAQGYGGNSGIVTAPQPYWHGAPEAPGPAS
jgi:hypothetical protein